MKISNKNYVKIFLTFALVISLLLITDNISTAQTDEENIAKEKTAYEKVKDYVTTKKPFSEVLAPEGEFIAVFNDKVSEWVQRKFDKPLVKEIRDTLAPYLRIELTERGFAPAASRALEGEKDETNYDAIWIRDNVWVYYSLLKDPERKDDARKLLLALWDYYSTDAQVNRFSKVIADPSLSADAMAMPHVRFNGNSPNLDDVMAGVKAEVWNHRQIDAHGIFFTALGEAAESGLITADDFTFSRFKVIALYPLFLDRINFEKYEDAGAWEELPRRNTSSIGLATRSIQVWDKLLLKNDSPSTQPIRDRFNDLIVKERDEVKQAWSAPSLESLISRGLGTVKRQLKLGGESPDYSPMDIHFRRADAALVFLIQPSPIEGLSEAEMRQALTIIETLKRPMGVLRYRNDSYQSGNYWIQDLAGEAMDKPSLTGDTSSADAFLWRLKKLIPDTEAEWFFDSLLALARLHLAETTDDPNMKQQDLYFATIHLKRALGQITGETMTADGKRVKPWQSPESINTIVMNGEKYYLPSPITPLNWAKASLNMALREYERIALESNEPPKQEESIKIEEIVTTEGTTTTEEPLGTKETMQIEEPTKSEESLKSNAEPGSNDQGVL